jgi:actin-related protein 8
MYLDRSMLFSAALLSDAISHNPFQSDVATNLYGFTVRRPNQPTVKYGFRVYDEVILAPMV